MKKGLILLCCLLLIGVTGCEKEKETIKEETKEEMIERILKENNYVMVDVRTKEEYETLHVKDAINIPVNEIDENVNLPKDKTIFVYCKSGVRSSQAEEKLKELGYNVINLGAFDSIMLEKE